MAKKATKRSQKGSSRKSQTTRKKATTKAPAPVAEEQPAASAPSAEPQPAATAEPKPQVQAKGNDAEPAVAAEPVITVTHEQIAERAYYLWQENGQAEGWDQDHWIEAERQLRNSHSAA